MLSNIETLTQYHDPGIICLEETQLRPSLLLNLRGYTTHRYDYLDGDRANGGTVILVKDCIFSAPNNIQTPL
jgi:hypothetical protein